MCPSPAIFAASLDHVLQDGLRILPAAHPIERPSQVGRVGRLVTLLKRFYRQLVGCLRLICSTGFAQGSSQVVVGKAVAGAQLNGPLQRLDCGRQLAGLSLDVPQATMSRGLLCTQTNRLLICGPQHTGGNGRVALSVGECKRNRFYGDGRLLIGW